MARGEASCPRLARQLVHKPADSGGLRIVYGGNLGCGGGNGFPIRWLDPVLAFQPGGGERIDVGGDVRCYATLLDQPGKGLLGRDPALAGHRARSGGKAAGLRLPCVEGGCTCARGGNQRLQPLRQGGIDRAGGNGVGNWDARIDGFGWPWREAGFVRRRG